MFPVLFLSLVLWLYSDSFSFGDNQAAPCFTIRPHLLIVFGFALLIVFGWPSLAVKFSGFSLVRSPFSTYPYKRPRFDGLVGYREANIIFRISCTFAKLKRLDMTATGG